MMILKHEFVEYIPDELEEGTLYISLIYKTALHKCVCWCGIEVVTPISPTDWQLTFDGESISLYPSIGNWSFPCRSHYWIKKNKIVWAPSWSGETNRQTEVIKKKKYYMVETGLEKENKISSRKNRFQRISDGVMRMLKWLRKS